MSKKWVFEALVTDSKDAIGLIAYALYKQRKHTLAESLREDGVPEPDIANQVKIFHDQTLKNGLEDYKEKSTAFLNEIFKQLEDTILKRTAVERDKLVAEHAQRELALKKEHAKKIKQEQRNLAKKIVEYEKDNKPILERFGAWLISGIPGVIASFLLTAIFIGSAVLLVPESKRQEIFVSLAAEYLNMPNPNKKP